MSYNNHRGKFSKYIKFNDVQLNSLFTLDEHRRHEMGSVNSLERVFSGNYKYQLLKRNSAQSSISTDFYFHHNISRMDFISKHKHIYTAYSHDTCFNIIMSSTSPSPK
jgi:hypothetical protein